ncbi:MAG: molybdopterin converting factor subunit 1 [Candidatus Thiodiazotropha sp. (ex. Lucinisca nassula)]|nr:molybdopterin converting factor subunit 1 [Candidatus Thiodiazotropha sp. (ex. Lucinisca nassula)]MBW9261900.1 molybdopterin converting factor subunit 1 [Candidatus Thiodiazotropha sp. (ex. Lucinisca nassula)]MBW9270927.1 molybdopterin converting factor subunit 1 [Candidatus Thiodiazotropha sp. (ex. Lucinisca nassula)]
MVQLRLFARFREELGVDSEQLESDDLRCVDDLLSRLRQRGGAWSRLLAEDQRIMMAVNQEMANPQTPLHAGDEIALFPPVTGG